MYCVTAMVTAAHWTLTQRDRYFTRWPLSGTRQANFREDFRALRAQANFDSNRIFENSLPGPTLTIQNPLELDYTVEGVPS